MTLTHSTTRCSHISSHPSAHRDPRAGQIRIAARIRGSLQHRRTSAMKTRVLLLATLLLCTAISTFARRTPHDLLHPTRTSSSSPPLRAQAPLVQELTSAAGVAWSVSGSSGNVSNAPATVPGNIYTDLWDAGVLDGDPLYRDNELRFRWVAEEESWTFAASFDLADDAAALRFPAVQLECDGIDTVASVELNGQLLGRTDNMHLRYTFDVLPWLRATNNKLRVRIFSPVAEAARRAAAYPYVVPRSVQLGSIPNGNFLRKGQSDFGWDWGPAFAGSGVWMPLRLVAFEKARVVGALVHQFHVSGMDASHRAALGSGLEGGDVLLRVRAFLRASDSESSALTGQLCASIDLAPAGAGSGPLSNCTIVTLPAPDLLGERGADVWLRVPAASAPLWWPVGYGAQPLFDLVATFTDGSGCASSVRRKVGFRTVELVREPGPEGQNGLSFYFKVNSLPIFIKGANMIPASVFHAGRVVGDSDITALLRSLQDSGCNAVRVWGGGIYQRDLLYSHADAAGILVWQEYAFACAMYPRDQEFLRSVRKEVAYQSRRIGGHPSVLVFGGNNENEAALNWFPETIQNRDMYLVDYAKLFLDVVREQWLLEQGSLEGEGEDMPAGGGAGSAAAGGAVGGVPFVSSSPSRGPLSEQPYVQRWGAAQSNDYGDVHYYNYVSDCGDASLLPRPRFVSEFGFQSLPSLHTLRKQLSEGSGDLAWNSSQLQYRQRHAGGYEEMAAQAALHFRLPSSSASSSATAADPLRHLERWVYLTQAVQALCYRTALAHWRRIKDSTPGRTMGAIYWQLNDVWAGPTWSGLEFGGRWKAAQYEVKRAFAPVVVSGFYNKTTNAVVAFVTSDMDATLRGRVRFNVSTWGGGSPPWRGEEVTFVLGPLQSREVWSADLSALFAAAGCPAPELCYITLGATIDAVEPTPGGGLSRVWPQQEQHQSSAVVVPRAEIFPRPLRLVPLLVPSFTFSDFAPGQFADAEADAGDDSDSGAEGDSSAADSDTPLLSASFSLATDVAAAGVFLSTALEGRFDDNSFVMDAGQRRTLTFSVPPATGPDGPQPTPFTLAQLRDSLQVMSLRDMYEDEDNDPAKAVLDTSAAAVRSPSINQGAAAARSATVQLRSAPVQLDAPEEIDSFALLTE